MNPRIFILFTAFFALGMHPAIAMDAEFSSDEEDTVELEATDQSFFASQLAGARELVSFGRSAAQSLLSHLTGTENANSGYQDALFNLFFNKPDAFNQLVRTLPADVNKLVAQYVLRSHPLIVALKKAIPDYACTAANSADIGILVKAQAGNIIASRCSSTKETEIMQFLGYSVPFGSSSEFKLSKNVVLKGMSLDAMRSCERTPVRLTSEENLQVRNRALNRAGDKIVISFKNNACRILDSKTSAILHYLPVTPAEFGAKIALNNAGNLIASCDGLVVKIFQIEPFESLCTLIGHTDTINSIEFNLDGNNLVTTSLDHTARTWDTRTGKCIFTLIGHNAILCSAKYNSIDDQIITIANEGTARIWNAYTGECTQILQWHRDLSSAEFNRTGDTIATYSKDGNVIIWNSSSGKPLHILAFFACYSPKILEPMVAFHDGILPDDIITVVDQHACFKSWSISVLNRLTNWLERECTLQQAMLLVAIYKYRIAPRVLKVRNQQAEQKLLDFIEYPHFEEQFAAMPAEMQHLLSRFVIRKTDEQTGC